MMRALQFGHGSSAVETRTSTADCLPLRRFNSATALQPWKPHCSWWMSAGRRRASIRPRLFSRGNPNSFALLPIQLKRFNSATALQPWKPQSARTASNSSQGASIRPRLFSRGNGDGVSHERHGRLASIRPRLFSRGNAISEGPELGAVQAASIRPRLFSRGNQENAGATGPARPLQFGHGSSAVETATHHGGPAPPPWLQFGHGSSAVETRSANTA